MLAQFSFRQQQILDIARQSGRVVVDDLAARFDVTPQTIRKDLNDLCGQRVLTRTHGGAILSSGVENVAYDARRILAQVEKEGIGRQAAALIPNNSSLFVNIGTTTEEVARHLVHHEGLLVITNNIHVAHILTPSPRIDVIIAGGMVRKTDGGIVGESAIDFISQFKVDRAVIGVSAIDDDGSLLDFDYREVMAARAIIKNARHVILVADACAAHGAGLVHISTDAVFDGEHPPYGEDDVPEPVHPYGVAKRRVELAVLDTVPDATVVRTSLIVHLDPDQPDSATGWVVDANRDGREVTLFTDEVRTAVRLVDLTAVLVELVELDASSRRGFWHVAGPERLSRAEIGEVIAGAFDLDRSLIRHAPSSTVAGPRPRDVSLHAERVDAELSVRPAPIATLPRHGQALG